MKINFSQILKNLDGSDAVQDGSPMTLGLVCALALNYGKAPNAKEAFERGAMAFLVYPGGEKVITPEQSAMCRAILHEVCPPAVAYQASKMLDPKGV